MKLKFGALFLCYGAAGLFAETAYLSKAEVELWAGSPAALTIELQSADLLAALSRNVLSADELESIKKLSLQVTLSPTLLGINNAVFSIEWNDGEAADSAKVSKAMGTYVRSRAIGLSRLVAIERAALCARTHSLPEDPTDSEMIEGIYGIPRRLINGDVGWVPACCIDSKAYTYFAVEDASVILLFQRLKGKPSLTLIGALDRRLASDPWIREWVARSQSSLKTKFEESCRLNQISGIVAHEKSWFWRVVSDELNSMGIDLMRPLDLSEVATSLEAR